MNKKLIAVAVAGVFAAPAVALAQTTIYGTLKAEWGIASQPDHPTAGPRFDAESLNSGASNIGFRGEEKLGGGMAAWYQCESDLRFLSGNATQFTGSICDRNSAIGLKGGFGNFFIGTWDSPIKRASGVTRITEETGWTGSQHMTLSSAAGPAGFSNRYTQSFNYDTPNMGGFTGYVQFTTLQATVNAVESAAAVAEGRVLGLGGMFATGPLAIVAAYEVRDENRATFSPQNVNSEDTAWLIGARYRIGPVTLGLTYTDLESDSGTGTVVSRTAWNLAGEWQIGAGAIRAGYALADDRETNGTSASDSGAVQYQIGYWHNLSKRTKVYAAYVKLDNDSFGVYNLTALTTGASNVKAGDSADVVAFGIYHTF
jgi:predicted porin